MTDTTDSEILTLFWDICRADGVEKTRPTREQAAAKVEVINLDWELVKTIVVAIVIVIVIPFVLWVGIIAVVFVLGKILDGYYLMKRRF